MLPRRNNTGMSDPSLDDDNRHGMTGSHNPFGGLRRDPGTGSKPGTSEPDSHDGTSVEGPLEDESVSMHVDVDAAGHDTVEETSTDVEFTPMPVPQNVDVMVHTSEAPSMGADEPSVVSSDSEQGHDDTTSHDDSVGRDSIIDASAHGGPTPDSVDTDADVTDPDADDTDNGDDSDGRHGDGMNFLDSDEPDETGDGHGRRKWLWVVIGVLIALLVTGVGFGAYYAMHPQSQRIDNSSKVGGNAIGGSSSSSDSVVDNASQEHKFLNDIGVPDFYQVPKEDQSDDQRNQSVEYALTTEPTNAVGRFMSKDSNPDLTDDPSKYLLEDGSTNPNYSYLTGENTTAVIRDDMERLVNPVYGDWTFLQDVARLDSDGTPQTIDSTNLMDMFDPAVSTGKEGEAGLRELTKLYADWDANEYGGEWHGKYTGDPIIGQIVDYNCDYNVKGAMDDTISCTAQVKYTGTITDENGGKTTKSVDRTLKLNYKVNYDSESASDRRILLTSVEQ